MGIEIEKKYRMERDAQQQLVERLRQVEATLVGEDFEENTLYRGHGLDPRERVLRLRRTERGATLTYKERVASESAIKRQREDETMVEDADALAAILDALGYRAALVYEKRRTTWMVAGVELVVDELPFGLFVEIEGDEQSILAAEELLGLSTAAAEHATYPQLTAIHGTQRGDLCEARFEK